MLQPNAILGNASLLVTLGMKGEIQGLFHPRRDFAQHIRESMAGIHINGRTYWSNNHEWHNTQDYQERSCILETRLSHPLGMEIEIIDFTPPQMPVLVRRFKIKSSGGGKFFYYSHFDVCEMGQKNSGFCDTQANILVQYWRDYHIGIKTTPRFQEWQIGKVLDPVWWTNAKLGAENGQLQNNLEDLGDINTAIGLPLPEGQEVTVYIGIAKSRQKIYNLLQETASKNPDLLLRETETHWNNWISRAANVKHHPRHYHRALIQLNLLNDPIDGAFIAAPEFDPEFQKSGGYGFCWNRDSTVIVQALHQAGYPEYTPRFLEWCQRTQLEDGSWFQRYWLNGDLAPSWGNFESSTQLDETGSTIHAICQYALNLPPSEQNKFLTKFWPTIHQGIDYLMKRTPHGLHTPCMDLWETFHGTFTYTNASIYAALQKASQLNPDPREARAWKKRAELIKKNIIEKLWTGNSFARGIINKQLDTTQDASILGTIHPFQLLTPENPREHEMITKILHTLENKLAIGVNGHHGIKRYENDEYRGGNPWIVTTLWLSQTMLQLAKHHQNKGNRTQTKLWKNKATPYIEWATRGTTSAGLFPEQVYKDTGAPAWAIPLGWSCALFIENIKLLEELEI